MISCLKAVGQGLGVANRHAENIICKSIRDTQTGEDDGETTQYPDTYMKGQPYFYYCDDKNVVCLKFKDGHDILFLPPRWINQNIRHTTVR